MNMIVLILSMSGVVLTGGEKMKNRILSVSMGVGFVLCGIAISIAADNSGKLPVLAPGSYTIGALLQAIRGNSSVANFIVPLNGTTPLTTAQYEANPGAMNGSKSVIAAGLGALVDVTDPIKGQNISGTSVVLKKAPGSHLQMLKDQKRITGFGKDYSNLVEQVLLYADIGGYPMFLFEPLPGGMIGTAGATSPIQALLDKWNVVGNVTIFNTAPVAGKAAAAARVGAGSAAPTAHKKPSKK